MLRHSTRLALAIGSLGLLGVLARADTGTAYLEVGSDSFAGQPSGFPTDFGGTNPWQYGEGGEFTVLVSGLAGAMAVDPASNGGFDIPAGYSPLALRSDPGTSWGYSASDNWASYAGFTGIESFCLESSIDYYLGATYTFSTGFAIQDPNSSVGSLSAGAAWLYEQFATGELANYHFTDDTARLTDAGLLQSAIWYLEGEVSDVSPDLSIDPYSPSPTVGNPFYDEAIARFGSLDAARQAVTDLDSSFGVEVLELSTPYTIAQDQMVYVGVPDGGRTGLMLAFTAGAMLIAAVTRPGRRPSC